MPGHVYWLDSSDSSAEHPFCNHCGLCVRLHLGQITPSQLLAAPMYGRTQNPKSGDASPPNGRQRPSNTAQYRNFPPIGAKPVSQDAPGSTFWD